MGTTNDDDEDVLAHAGADFDDEEIETRMRTWALPIAERVLAAGTERGFSLPSHFIEPGSTPQQALADWIGAVTMMFMGDGPSKLLPRSAQESGTGTLRFRRDAAGELCFTIDERPEIDERMCIRDPLIGMFTGGAGHLSLPTGMLPHELIVATCEEVEKAILSGDAYLMAFSHDASKSTPEEAVYVRSPGPGEVEQEREAWARHDESQASLEAMRKERVAKLATYVDAIAPGALVDLLLQLGDGVTIDDLEFGLGLLFAQLHSYLADARQPDDNPVVVLRRDGSVKGAIEIPAAYVVGRLNEDLTELAPERSPDRPVSISPMGIILFAVEVCSRFPDHEPDYRCAPDPEGLRLTYANALPST